MSFEKWTFRTGQPVRYDDRIASIYFALVFHVWRQDRRRWFVNLLSLVCFYLFSQRVENYSSSLIFLPVPKSHFILRRKVYIFHMYTNYFILMPITCPVIYMTVAGDIHSLAWIPPSIKNPFFCCTFPVSIWK